MTKTKEVAWKSLFETYYGKKLNELLNEGKKLQQYSFALQQKASNTGERLSQSILKSNEKKKTYRKHKINEYVFVWIGKKSSKATTSYLVMLRIIENTIRN